MATIAIAGKDFNLFFEKDGDYVIFGCTRGASLKLGAGTLDVSCKGSGGWADVLPGEKNWSIDFDGVYRVIDPADADTNYSALETYQALVDGTKISARFGPSGTGNKQLAGDGYITSLSIEAPKDGETTFSGTITGAGPLDLFTIPA